MTVAPAPVEGPVVPVLCPGALPESFEAAVDWFAAVSGGRAAFQLRPVTTSAPAGGWEVFAAAGGRSEPPDNSQVLVGELVTALAPADRARLGELVVVIPPADTGFVAHTWRLLRGGVHLGGRRWARRYAVVPEDAPMGTVAHELGHLLLGWPDLDRRIGADCLMAMGGHRGGGADPAPPCAPLRLSAGWVSPLPVQAGTRLRDLQPGGVGTWGEMVFERRGGSLLAFRTDPPRLLARISIADGDESRPLLAVLAEEARTFACLA